MITTLRRLKKKLQDNLSLSSKLFLRGFFVTVKHAAIRCGNAPRDLVQIVATRLDLNIPGIANRKQYDLKPPASVGIDFSVPVKTLTGKNPERELSAINVQISIVIPVFDKAPFTFQCLRSLIQEISCAETEILVVDNGSTDETAQVLSYFGDYIRVMTNEHNRGFVDACNQGAAAARGEYLLFLNNDTEVLPGWLTNLVDTLERHPSAGAVGSMFLYPDGSIQEAGAIVWSNGEAQHYGWGGSPDDKRFNFAREVDYCSAASLLIRKNLFQQLGGFDRRYAPAYYEDIDLCFGVRSLGYKVIYQPMSRLVHYEGATAGRDVAKGVKQFQILNRERFVEKWSSVLEREHPAKNLGRLEEAALHRKSTSIVVFDERIPSPDRDAGSLRMFMILKTLAQWASVVFVPFNRPQGIEYEQALWKEGIQTANVVDYRRILRKRKPQAAIISRPSIAEAMVNRIRRANNQVKIVFDMVDAHFIRLEREAQISGDPLAARAAKSYRKLETRVARASDLVWCNSSEDKRIMQVEAPSQRIEVIPTIHELHEIGKPFAERKDLLFVGNMAHKPNADGVLYFIREILTLIDKQLPGLTAYILGANPSEEILTERSKQVQVLGYQRDLGPWLSNCRVFIAPIRFGAGVKGKIGEAMSYGLPTVTTSVGAEGFGLTHGSNIMIGDDAAGFAECVVQLYSQKGLWQTLARNSRWHVEQNFTPEVIAETINNSIREVSSKSPGGMKCL